MKQKHNFTAPAILKTALALLNVYYTKDNVGILWNCGMVDQETFQMTASYDDAHLRKVEVEEAVEKLFDIARWITEPGNWEVVVGSCPVSEKVGNWKVKLHEEVLSFRTTYFLNRRDRLQR
jgi:hypothetical protein